MLFLKENFTYLNVSKYSKAFSERENLVSSGDLDIRLVLLSLKALAFKLSRPFRKTLVLLEVGKYKFGKIRKLKIKSSGIFL